MIEPSYGASEEERSMHRWRVFAIVSVGVFMAGLDLFIVNIAFPDIRARLRRHEPRRACRGS